MQRVQLIPSNTMITIADCLSQAERLALASMGTPEDVTPTQTGPRFALPTHILRGGIPVAPRYYMPDEDEGETCAELAISGEDDDDTERHYASHRLPSSRNRGAVYGELKNMGFAWND